ncbi:nickel-type superoxide dismutase maturation protease [Prochlorococcus sp. MIT 1223]|uniref:nickel-type superoxide dismutase maturation protease n=1 Tax=Prochlorococcus sp. MIT 1223 TaxID=3096217 RepID=UPI0039C3E289
MCRVKGISMLPTLKHGDLVIYKAININYINDCLEKGSIVISKHPLKANYLIVKRLERKEKDKYFIIGDNKDFSKDSRHFGFIQKQNLVGIAESFLSLPILNKSSDGK